MTMRSFWMDRLRGHADVGDRVLTSSAMALTVSPSPVGYKNRAASAPSAAVKRTRLCLGIGDGIARRQ
jgi:hypothetical protein